MFGLQYNIYGLQDMFQPISENCVVMPNGTIEDWPNISTQSVKLPLMGDIQPRPTFLPSAVPKDLSERIIKFHSDPIVWWVSQILRFLFRTKPEAEKMFKDAEKEIGFVKPVVGIQVRRTDKLIWEAIYHSVDEYMKYVEEYFELWEIREGKTLENKRIFVASDDPKVLEEFQTKYPGMTVLAIVLKNQFFKQYFNIFKG